MQALPVGFYDVVVDGYLNQLGRQWAEVGAKNRQYKRKENPAFVWLEIREDALEEATVINGRTLFGSIGI